MDKELTRKNAIQFLYLMTHYTLHHRMGNERLARDAILLIGEMVKNSENCIGFKTCLRKLGIEDEEIDDAIDHVLRNLELIRDRKPLEEIE